MSKFIAYHPPELYEALKAEGWTMPEGCGDVEILLPVDGVVQMKLNVLMTAEVLMQIGGALARIAKARLTPPEVVEFGKLETCEGCGSKLGMGNAKWTPTNQWLCAACKAKSARLGG
jgi:hypothetical protein